jgi:hypothetical protein
MASAGALVTGTVEDQRNEKNCARWLPHCSTAEQKQKCLEIATLLKQRFNIEGQASLLPKKFQRAQSEVKQMMIFAYDHQGFIMTDRVPCGTSVTVVYYRH